VAVVLGQLSTDPWLETKLLENPDACDLSSEFMVVTNTVSVRQDLVTLFCKNKLGVDVDVCVHQTLTISHSNFVAGQLPYSYL
jgi:hypothetical protein